jgi:hypothetical protein
MPKGTVVYCPEFLSTFDFEFVCPFASKKTCRHTRYGEDKLKQLYFMKPCLL